MRLVEYLAASLFGLILTCSARAGTPEEYSVNPPCNAICRSWMGIGSASTSSMSSQSSGPSAVPPSKVAPANPVPEQLSPVLKQVGVPPAGTPKPIRSAQTARRTLVPKLAHQEQSTRVSKASPLLAEELDTVPTLHSRIVPSSVKHEPVIHAEAPSSSATTEPLVPSAARVINGERPLPAVPTDPVSIKHEPEIDAEAPSSSAKSEPSVSSAARIINGELPLPDVPTDLVSIKHEPVIHAAASLSSGTSEPSVLSVARVIKGELPLPVVPTDPASIKPEPVIHAEAPLSSATSEPSVLSVERVISSELPPLPAVPITSVTEIARSNPQRQATPFIAQNTADSTAPASIDPVATSQVVSALVTKDVIEQTVRPLTTSKTANFTMNDLVVRFSFYATLAFLSWQMFRRPSVGARPVEEPHTTHTLAIASFIGSDHVRILTLSGSGTKREEIYNIGMR